MSDMSDMSDSPHEEHGAIPVDRKVNARDLSRKTAGLLREVGFEGRTFAIEHCGRVIGFLVPSAGRVPVQRGRKVVYEVPEPERLLELDAAQREVVETLYREGHCILDQLCAPERPIGPVAVALAALEATEPPLIVKTWRGYELTAAGIRHAEELGL